MIGIIVTGHGNFASGMSSAVNLLTGVPSNFEVVDYLQEHSVDDLQLNLKEAINKLQECEGIIIFTDLIDGSPYKCSVSLVDKYDKKIIVMSGTNLGMLVETTISRGLIFDVNDLSDMALNIGKDQTLKYNNLSKI